MSRLHLKTSQANVLWLEGHRAIAAGRVQNLHGFPSDEHISSLLSSMPPGPTLWILDDLWAPCVILRDAVEIPTGSEAREEFFRWKYKQLLALEGDFSVQAQDIGESAILLGGIDQEIRERWMQMALRMNRPIHQLIPRWLWVYNHLAPTRERPGMLLSLCPATNGSYSGTLAAWGRSLVLLRQWEEPMDPETWVQERILPTASYLQRESRPPLDLTVWGAGSWPEIGISVRVLPPEFPTQEAI